MCLSLWEDICINILYYQVFVLLPWLPAINTVFKTQMLSPILEICPIVERTRWQRRRWPWSTSLSTDTSGIHLQTQKCMKNTSWEWTGVPDQRKRIYRTTQNLVELGTRGKKRGVSRTGPAFGEWGNWSRGSDPHSGATDRVRGETFNPESETADMWQPTWNENQTVIAAAICTPNRSTGLLEGLADGS